MLKVEVGEWLASPLFDPEIQVMGQNVGQMWGFCFVGSCILPYKGNTFTWGVKSLCFIFRTFTVESQLSRRKSSKICLSFYLMRYSFGVMDRQFKSFESYGNVKWQGGEGYDDLWKLCICKLWLWIPFVPGFYVLDICENVFTIRALIVKQDYYNYFITEVVYAYTEARTLSLVFFNYIGYNNHTLM